MKIVCIECDRRMGLESPSAADDRTDLTFSCSACGRAVVLSINASESQLVGAMGIDVTGGPRPPFATTSSLLGTTVTGAAEGSDDVAVEWTDDAAEVLRHVAPDGRPEAAARAEQLAAEEGSRYVDRGHIESAARSLGKAQEMEEL